MADERQIDFVLVFALQKELLAFLRHVGEYTTEHKGVTFHRAELRLSDQQCYHLIAIALPEMGNYAAATVTTRAIDVWNPRFILLGGIAGGAKRPGVQLGDVVVADVIVGYEPGKQRPEKLERRLKFLRAADVLVDAAKNLEPREWALGASVSRPDGKSDRVIPRVHFGTVVSGEKVIASADWMRELSKDIQSARSSDAGQIAAVEMEAYGTALAAYRAPTAPGMLMAKAICDWADANKNDGWQEYAADVSATFLVALLKSRPVPVSMAREQAIRVDAKPYSGRSKIGLCGRMDDNWEDLADYYDIPLADRKLFRPGRECQDIWKWLENRKKLGGLPEALKRIGREDLIDELLPQEPGEA